MCNTTLHLFFWISQYYNITITVKFCFNSSIFMIGAEEDEQVKEEKEKLLAEADEAVIKRKAMMPNLENEE